MEIDEVVGDERAQVESRGTWEPRVEFPDSPNVVEEEQIRTPETERAPKEEEQMTTPRAERATSDRSEGRDTEKMDVENPEILSVAEITADRGLAFTEEELRKAVRSNSHAVLARAAETPISEIDIPLCQMVAMIEVRKPLEVDI